MTPRLFTLLLIGADMLEHSFDAYNENREFYIHMLYIVALQIHAL